MIRRPPRSTLFPYTRRCRSSGTVDEGNLTAVTDSYGSGNDSGTTSTSGSLTNVVHFGADGPHQTLGVNDGYQFTVITGAAILSGITSHGSALHASVSANTLTPLDASNHTMFTLPINKTTGGWPFTKPTPLDHLP